MVTFTYKARITVGLCKQNIIESTTALLNLNDIEHALTRLPITTDCFSWCIAVLLDVLVSASVGHPVRWQKAEFGPEKEGLSLVIPHSYSVRIIPIY